MIAALAIAAYVLAPTGTATIQAYPVCVPVTVQPGHSYPLSVWVSGGSVTLAVNPAHDTQERSLHQVPASWVTFASDPAGPGTVPLTLSVPPDAAPGAYWSDIAGTTGQARPGAGQAQLGTSGTAALVFTVGPSATPPPPCAALDVAYSTGRFPAWPTEAFATTGWKQVFAEEQRDNPKPITSPTAGTGAPAADPAPPMSPVADPVPAGSPKIPANWPGWLAIIGIGLLVIAGLRKLFKS